MNIKKEFSAIIKIIEQARLNAYTAVNIELIKCYWQVGEFISSRVANAIWDHKTVDQLAEYIQNEYPGLKGYNCRGLYGVKQFHETYTNLLFVAEIIININ